MTVPSKLRYLIASAALIMGIWSAPAWAQVVSPQPAEPTDALSLSMTLNAQSCFNRIESVQLDVDSRPIVVNYVVEPNPDAVCPVSPPLMLDIALGSFEPGSYELMIDGTIDGEAQPTASASFEVLGSVAARSVPLNSEFGLFFLAFSVLLLGVVRARV